MSWNVFLPPFSENVCDILFLVFLFVCLFSVNVHQGSLVFWNFLWGRVSNYICNFFNSYRAIQIFLFLLLSALVIHPFVLISISFWYHFPSI